MRKESIHMHARTHTHTHTYIPDSLCYTEKTNNVANQLYTNKN